jgi:hypothetical protein
MSRAITAIMKVSVCAQQKHGIGASTQAVFSAHDAQTDATAQRMCGSAALY